MFIALMFIDKSIEKPFLYLIQLYLTYRCLESHPHASSLDQRLKSV